MRRGQGSASASAPAAAPWPALPLDLARRSRCPLACPSPCPAAFYKVRADLKCQHCLGNPPLHASTRSTFFNLQHKPPAASAQRLCEHGQLMAACKDLARPLLGCMLRCHVCLATPPCHATCATLLLTPHATRPHPPLCLPPRNQQLTDSRSQITSYVFDEVRATRSSNWWLNNAFHSGPAARHPAVRPPTFAKQALMHMLAGARHRAAHAAGRCVHR